MARVRFNREQVNLTARFRGSALVRGLGERVERGARALIPTGSHHSGSGAPSRSRPLLSSVYSKYGGNTVRVHGTVGAKTDHAATVHQGSSAHTIRSQKGKMLKFRWERGDFLIAARSGRRRGNRRSGRFHYFASVRHPGNKRPVRYLTTPLNLFGRNMGFRVTTSGVNRTRLP